MAINVIGVRRNLRRRRLNRRTGRRQFFGEKGWIWQEVILGNSFASLDNSASTSEIVFSGGQFSETNVGGARTKVVVLRRIIAQLWVTTVLPDFSLYPMVMMDVGLLHVKQSAIAELYPFNTTTNADLEATQELGQARLLAHERLWTMNAWNERPSGEDPPTIFSDLQGKNSVYFDFRPNLPLEEQASVQVVLSQCGAELYADGTDFLLSGYVKAFVQRK